MYKIFGSGYLTPGDVDRRSSNFLKWDSVDAKGVSSSGGSTSSSLWGCIKEVRRSEMKDSRRGREWPSSEVRELGVEELFCRAGESMEPLRVNDALPAAAKWKKLSFFLDM